MRYRSNIPSKQTILRPHFEVMNHYLTEHRCTINIAQSSEGVELILIHNKEEFYKIEGANIEQCYEEMTGFLLAKVFKYE